jgi:hypothetical protein
MSDILVTFENKEITLDFLHRTRNLAGIFDGNFGKTQFIGFCRSLFVGMFNINPVFDDSRDSFEYTISQFQSLR